MPHAEIPVEEQTDSTGSSLSSLESRRHHRANDPASDSTNSSLRSDQEFEEAINAEGFQAQPYYLPIVIPPEPTLDELLKRVSGQENLVNVESIRLRVISYMVSLSRLSGFMPRLTSLNLDGSVLCSLRDLGCGLTYLKYLNVSNCGLSSLDGTNGIPTVEILIADGNMIEIVSPLGNLTLLSRLSLKDNRIRNLGLLSFLGLCPLLQEVNLEGNSVTRNVLYRNEMFRSVRSLKLLDGKSFDEIRNSDEFVSNSSGSEPSSHLSEEELLTRESDVESDNNITQTSLKRRPATSQEIYYITTSRELERSQSADIVTGKRILTSGDPLYGSVLATARQKRQRQIMSGWKGSNSSSDSLTSSDFIREKTFPFQLPQTPVDLELGIIEPGISSASDTESSSSLKEIAQKWRAECQRKKNFTAK